MVINDPQLNVIRIGKQYKKAKIVIATFLKPVYMIVFVIYIR